MPIDLRFHAQQTRSPRPWCSLALVALAGLALALALQGGIESALAFSVPFQTGIDVAPASGGAEQQALAHVHGLGGRFVRLAVDWRSIAPASLPPGFDPANPDDPSYSWRAMDAEVQAAVAHGLTPFITITGVPAWASAGSAGGPDPAQLALFFRAFATRYDGSHAGLPWVRYWEVWNEPNSTFFLPQVQEGRAVAVDAYRAMVNDVAAAVHAVRAEDVVIAGALFPNELHLPNASAIAPLQFTREVLCISSGRHPRRTCNTKVQADAWSVHPYTSGGPSTLPANPEDVWIDSLGSLTRLLATAQRLGAFATPRPVQLWVTEFGWDSHPPTRRGVPVKLEQRWIAETLYRAWQAGVGLFSWYSLRDEPGVAPQRAGLYYPCPHGTSCYVPKPAVAAFRFPFVAYSSPGRAVSVWGRTPAGTPGSVGVQWLAGGRWLTFMRLRSDRDGIFRARLALPGGASATGALLRAALRGEDSPAFSLHRTPDIIVPPFET